MKTFSWEMFDDERFRAAADFWTQALNNRLLPRREDIKFAANPDLAAECSIFSRTDEGAVQIVYAGTDMLRQANLATAGTNLLDAYPVPLRRASESWLYKVFSFPCGYISQHDGMMPDGTRANLKTLNFPLGDRTDVPRLILSVAHADNIALGLHFSAFFKNIVRLRFQPIDIGAGCPEPVDVTAETDFI